MRTIDEHPNKAERKASSEGLTLKRNARSGTPVLPFALAVPSQARSVTRTDEELVELRRAERDFFGKRGIPAPIIAGHNSPYSTSESTSYQTSAGTTTATADSQPDYNTDYRSDTRTDYSWDEYA